MKTEFRNWFIIMDQEIVSVSISLPIGCKVYFSGQVNQVKKIMDDLFEEKTTNASTLTRTSTFCHQKN